MTKIKSVCVYCGSSPGNSPHYMALATQLGEALATAGKSLVYGGGTNGLMGAVARGTHAKGGSVCGIIPEFLLNREATVDELGFIDDLVITKNMHERKHLMFERADAFITLPGGIGTLEEVVEMMTWAQLDRHSKPIVLANVGGFWDPFVSMLDHMSDAGFIHTAHKVKPLVLDGVEAIIDALSGA